MPLDSAYAYASFSAIGGFDYEGQSARTLRLFASLEQARAYALELLDQGYDYAYVMGHGADGAPDLANVVRVADDEPSLIRLAA